MYRFNTLHIKHHHTIEPMVELNLLGKLKEENFVRKIVCFLYQRQLFFHIDTLILGHLIIEGSRLII